MSIRTFTRAQLDALGLPDETVTADCAAEYPEFTVELHREYIESRRWESVNALVFRAPDDGKAYRVTYRKPLTEMQDSDPWNYEDTVEAVEVEQRPVTVMQWQPVDEMQAADQAAVLTNSERQFLTFALDLAFDRMVSDDGFTDEDEAALEKFRRLAAGAQS